MRLLKLLYEQREVHHLFQGEGEKLTDTIARSRRPQTEILWCPNGSKAIVRRRLVVSPAGRKKTKRALGEGTVVHFFGGKSKFGTRMDIDLMTNPDVLADAWLPPFAPCSFDTVILDPPYVSVSREVMLALFCAASFTAARQVIWFHTIWAPSGAGLRLRESWLVRVGDSCLVRCLQRFQKVRQVSPMRRFHRGPQMKYNRWLISPQGLPFPIQEEL